jgi:hypothetical protein
MEILTTYELLGQQIIVLPPAFRFKEEMLYAIQDGITVLLIPVSDEGEEILRELRRTHLTDIEAEDE